MDGVDSEVVRWNTPTQTQEHVQNVTEYFQDAWRPRKWLSLPIGLRIDSSTGQANSASNHIGWTTVQPRLGFVISVWPSGIVLQVSWSRYGHLLQGRYLDYGNPGALGEQVYRLLGLNSGAIGPSYELGPLLVGAVRPDVTLQRGPTSMAREPRLSRPGVRRRLC